MKKFRNISAALLVMLMLAATALPAYAEFERDTLDGIVMITTGAPDKDGIMNYWRGTGFFVGEAGNAPQHGGMVVQLHGQPVQIGRDGAVCRLVYQDGTPGVSGRHCQVSFEQGQFVLTDLNSTYGTFLSNGQRVAPNSPVKLPPKSSFYLGETDNTVYVDLE